MIVISGALVVVALVLLVIGLVIAGLGWVYGSIAVSLLSFVFLVIGILQRRKEAPATAETPALATTLARSTGSSVDPSTESVAVRTAPPVAAASVSDDEATVTTLPTAAAAAASGKVLVVAGRPRYHVEGCRYLTGKDAESVDVGEARAEGFTACGVCKPDAALTTAADGADSTTTSAFETPVSAEVPDGVVDDAPVEEPVRKAPARARTSAAAAPAKAAAKKAAPAKKAAAPAKKAAPVKKAAAPAKAVKKAAPAKAAPAKAAAAKTTAKSTAAKAPAKKAPAKKAPAKRV